MFTPNQAGFAQLEAAVGTFEHDIAERVASHARELVAVDTGATRDSIHVVDVDGHAEVVVGGAGVFLELGTQNMSAEPFLYPASLEAAREVPDLARQDLGAAS